MPSPKLERAKQAYTDEARRLAAQSMAQLEEAKVTPDALTISGVGLCIAGSVAVFFEYLGWGFDWLGAVLFVVGSVLDILDGALARSRGIGSPFGAFLDSTVDRVGEGFMIAAIGLVLAPIDDLVLPATMALLAATAWITVVQRILFVRKQLRAT